MVILPTKGEIEWTSVEAKGLRDFLFSDAGKKLLTLCISQAPSLLDGADVNKALVASGERKGFEFLLDYIVGLTIEPPPKPVESSEYPSLDDDSKWPDTEAPSKPE